MTRRFNHTVICYNNMIKKGNQFKTTKKKISSLNYKPAPRKRKKKIYLAERNVKPSKWRRIRWWEMTHRKGIKISIAMTMTNGMISPQIKKMISTMKTALMIYRLMTQTAKTGEKEGVVLTQLWHQKIKNTDVWRRTDSRLKNLD